MNRYFVEQINALGIGLSHEEAWANFPGTSLQLCIDYVEEKFDVTLPSNFTQKYREGQKRLFAEFLKPIAGVHHCLSALDSYRLCVASNGPMQIISDNLGHTGLKSYFEERIFSAYEIECWKPDPTLFNHAASTLQYANSQCFVIEDSVAGITAGVAAGMQVFAYQAPHLKNHPEVPEGVVSFNDMNTLPLLIQEIAHGRAN